MLPRGQTTRELPAAARIRRPGRAPLLERANAGRPDHREAWESTAMDRREQLRRILGESPARRSEAKAGTTTTEGTLRTLPVTIHPEPDMPLPALWRRGPTARPAPIPRACS